MSYDPKEDARVFGEGTWVYCASHCHPHMTGWCTVATSEKIPLLATTREEAYEECRELKLYIHGEGS